MNNDPHQSQRLTRDFSAETATRGENTSAPAAGTPLRRWSVAELIARAFAARPADGMSHA